jgi:hypothetical protein
MIVSNLFFRICLEFGVWYLEFVWNLVFGFWNLLFWYLFGIWFLDFGICFFGICLEFGFWNLEFLMVVSIMYQWKICFMQIGPVILHELTTDKQYEVF